MSNTLKEKTKQGLVWSFLDKSGQQLIYLISGIFLARILTPADYGLVGVLGVFIALSNALVDSGFNRGLLNKKEVTQVEYNTVFYFNLVISVLLYGILFGIAPLIAAFFKQPQLTDLSRVVFLAIPLNALSSIQNLILWKNLNFKDQTKSSVIALLISSIISITIALQGFGVWALVSQGVLFALGKTIILWILNRWRPTKIVRFRILKEMFSFGSKLLAVSIINVFFANIYALIIGKFYAISQVGYYSQANKYQDIPTGIIGNTFRSVAAPVFSEVNQDNQRMKKVTSKMIKSTAFISFPITIYLILVAKPLFSLLITDKWLPAVPLFQILCLAGSITIFITLLSESVISKGHSGIFLGVELVKKGFLLLLIALLIQKGVTGLAISWVLYSVISLVISLYYVNKLFNYSLLLFLKDTYPYLLISLFAGSLSYFTCWNITNYWGLLFTHLGAITFSYLSVCKLIKLEISGELFKLIKSKREPR